MESSMNIYKYILLSKRIIIALRSIKIIYHTHKLFDYISVEVL